MKSKREINFTPGLGFIRRSPFFETFLEIPFKKSCRAPKGQKKEQNVLPEKIVSTPMNSNKGLRRYFEGHQNTGQESHIIHGIEQGQ